MCVCIAIPPFKFLYFDSCTFSSESQAYSTNLRSKLIDSFLVVVFASGSTNEANKDSNRLADNFAASTLQPNTVITVSPIVSPSSRDAETCQAANQRSSTFSYYNNSPKLYGANNQRVISNPEPTSPIFCVWKAWSKNRL